MLILVFYVDREVWARKYWKLGRNRCTRKVEAWTFYPAVPRTVQVLQDWDFSLSSTCPKLWMSVWKSKTQDIYLKLLSLCQWSGCVFESTGKKEAVRWNAGVLSHNKRRLEHSKVNFPLLWQTEGVFRVWSGLVGSHVQDLRLLGQVS